MRYLWQLMAGFLGIGAISMVVAVLQSPNDFFSTPFGWLASIMFGAFLNMAAVGVSFEIQGKARDKTLNSARRVFLMDKGQELKTSYFKLVCNLVLCKDGENLDNLDKKTWRSNKKGNWPNNKDVEAIQEQVKKAQPPMSIDDKVDSDVTRLQSVVDGIIQMASSKQLFEGQEYLENEMWTAKLKVSWLQENLTACKRKINTSNQDQAGEDWKKVIDAIYASGQLLVNICKLNDRVNVQLEVEER